MSGHCSRRLKSLTVCLFWQLLGRMILTKPYTGFFIHSSSYTPLFPLFPLFLVPIPYISSCIHFIFRRITLVIDFMAPDYEMRDQIWKSILPPHMPISSDVEWHKLAMDYELTGGLIKNVWHITLLIFFILFFRFFFFFLFILFFVFCRLSCQHFRLQSPEMPKMCLLQTAIFSIQVRKYLFSLNFLKFYC
jgi:hypothetical protein